MLDRTQDNSKVNAEQRRAGDVILPLAFFGIAGVAMVFWIGAIVWATWRLIAWIFW